MAEINLIIFDCDGVLFDSRPANVAFHNAVLETIGQPRLDSAGEDLGHYLAAGQLYDRLFGLDTPLRGRAGAVARGMDYSPFYEYMEPAEGLFEVLAALGERYKLAMASNRSRTAQGVADRFGLDRYLDLVVGTSDVEHPKPAPDMLEFCMRRLDTGPADSLFVGDATTDRIAAEAAGMHFVGIGEASGAEDPIGCLAELAERLRAIGCSEL